MRKCIELYKLYDTRGSTDFIMNFWDSVMVVEPVRGWFHLSSVIEEGSLAKEGCGGGAVRE